MPNAALNAYLARNYLDGAKAEAMLARAGDSTEKRKRKKKRADAAESSQSAAGLRLVDEGDESWKRQRDSDEEVVLVVADEDEQRRKKEKWGRVGGKEEQAMAMESEAADEKPQMAGEDELSLDDSMQTVIEQRFRQQQQEGRSCEGRIKTEKKGLRAGLKTKEEMRAERLERERFAALTPADKASAADGKELDRARQRREREEAAQETVYRDATGRRIDVQKDDDERRRVKEEEKRREQEKKDWNKGQVQLLRAKEAKRREEEERHTTFARYSSDTRMNEELREIQRAADPALGFLTKKQTRGPQKPAYKGSFPPNRFGIRPGSRWDGVERSNGFESKFFQKKHERVRRQEEMDAWGKEDM